MTWRVAVLSILVVTLVTGCGSDSTRPGAPLRTEPDTLRFGPVLLGAPDTLALAIFNDGGDAVSLQVRSEFPEFFLGQGDTLAIDIPPRDSVSVGVVFAPLSPGQKQGTIRIEGDRQAMVGCTGTAESAECSVTPQALDFGQVPTGSTREKSFVLRNQGTVAFSGRVSEECSDFRLTEGAGLYKLEPGDSLRVTVEFSPQVVGPHWCSVDLGAPSCESVQCTGTGSRVWYVKADGTGDAPTVQAAIDSSANGQMVLVGPGTYYENINMRGKAIHLKGELGPEQTILDGSGLDSSVVVCNTDERNDTIVDGFTITGGRGTLRGVKDRRGGGIYCNRSAPTIRNNIVRENTAQDIDQVSFSFGGGIYAIGPTDLTPAVIEQCLIENNFASANGGGIAVTAASIIRDNVVRANSTYDGDGGGIWAFMVADPTLIEGNVVQVNMAGDHGGGIYLSNTYSVAPSRIVIRQNLILRNSSATRVAMDCSGGGIWLSGGAELTNNTIALNTASNIAEIPAAGGCCLQGSSLASTLSRNLLYKNGPGGVVAMPATEGALSENLLFGNGEMNLYLGEGANLDATGNILVDPLFCDTTSTSMGELAEESPALNQPFGVIGAVSEPSCSRPQESAWTRMRGLYR